MYRLGLPEWEISSGWDQNFWDGNRMLREMLKVPKKRTTLSLLDEGYPVSVLGIQKERISPP